MVLTKDFILKKLKENKEEVRVFGVKKLVLFGSYAYGEQKRGSDIDFLVEYRRGRGLFRDSSGLMNFLNDLFDCDVDLVKPKYVRKELRPYIL
ncbi:MAG: nucleotidyltransferase [Candidatus Nanohalarchaeota archaeon]|nr:MAG: nucleotidyltransferase [Candidatus Nanohaloarchaeota archaeon]